MFVLSNFTDVVRLAPDSFASTTELALTQAINGKFANKVVEDVGLCVCLYDILDATDGTIKAGDGGAFLNVAFRLVVFRPFRGEVLTGAVSSCTESGIKVSLGFFDDILVPAHLLFQNTSFRHDAQSYLWTTDEQTLDIQVDDPVRFQVEEEHFVDCTPGKKGEVQQGVAPYSLTCSMMTPGLGCVAWWAD